MFTIYLYNKNQKSHFYKVNIQIFTFLLYNIMVNNQMFTFYINYLLECLPSNISLFNFCYINIKLMNKCLIINKMFTIYLYNTRKIH